MSDRKVEFLGFGYGPYKEKRCWVCGEKPVRVEPRFLYSACIDCFDKYTPVEFSRGKFRNDE